MIALQALCWLGSYRLTSGSAISKPNGILDCVGDCHGGWLGKQEQPGLVDRLSFSLGMVSRRHEVELAAKRCSGSFPRAQLLPLETRYTSSELVSRSTSTTTFTTPTNPQITKLLEPAIHRHLVPSTVLLVSQTCTEIATFCFHKQACSPILTSRARGMPDKMNRIYSATYSNVYRSHSPSRLRLILNRSLSTSTMSPGTTLCAGGRMIGSMPHTS